MQCPASQLGREFIDLFDFVIVTVAHRRVIGAKPVKGNVFQLRRCQAVEHLDAHLDQSVRSLLMVELTQLVSRSGSNDA